MKTDIPSTHIDLLESPSIGHLGTVRPNGAVQVNPMWFMYHDGTIRFSHTTQRQKYRNLMKNPTMSLSILDPNDPSRYVEVRGKLVETIPDTSAEFYLHISRHYGVESPELPADIADRVVLVMSIDSVSSQ